jgi:hypothetical protein
MSIFLLVIKLCRLAPGPIRIIFSGCEAAELIKSIITGLIASRVRINDQITGMQPYPDEATAP